MSAEIHELHEKVDGLNTRWAEMHALLQRETTQARREATEARETAERDGKAQRRRSANGTRIWLAVVAAAATIVNGGLQVIGQHNRDSLRAEILTEVKGEQTERETRLANAAADRAVEKNNRHLELMIKGKQ